MMQFWHTICTESMKRLLLIFASALLVFLCLSQDTTRILADEPASWHEQLEKIDPSAHAVAGQWRTTALGLRTDATASSRLVVPANVPREYDLRVQFTRHTGQHSIAIFFTSGQGRATFEIDAWSNHLAGIQNIGGQSIQQNATKATDHALENDRRYIAEVRVRRDNVKVLLGGTEVATYRGDGSELSIIPLWQIPADAQIAVGAYQSEATFHSIELRTVTSESKTASATEATMAKTPPIEAASPSKPSKNQPKRQGGTKRVLIVIADHHFFYREYADPRRELEKAGFAVEVAAGNRNVCHPHPNSGQGESAGSVQPDFALADVDPSRYDAIVFSGGWGASMYQFAFPGRYDNASYNGDTAKKTAANRLIKAFHDQDKYICGICNGVSVLAWSRIHGSSLLTGATCTAPTRAAPKGIYNGRRGNPSIRWHVQQNNGRLVPAGSIGNPRSRADDVVVDGKIITAEDDHSAREAGRKLAELLR